MLAGDTLRAAADLGLPTVGVTLLHRMGLFRQQIDDAGQIELPHHWFADGRLNPVHPRVRVMIEGVSVVVQAWLYELVGSSGHTVPVFMLDTALPDNNDYHQSLTDHLYGGDERYRLCQEVLLGPGGIAVLTAQGYLDIDVFHMN